uniref:Uncharacterized protein n=1 Tax=Plectus sambesii TaxID=2011161 RepID=A0A914XRJ9_9BILA
PPSSLPFSPHTTAVLPAPAPLTYALLNTQRHPGYISSHLSIGEIETHAHINRKERSNTPIIRPTGTVAERKNRYLGTSSGLQIAVVQPRDAGKYFCVATNPYTNQTRHSKNAVNLVVDDRAPTLSSSFTPHFVYPEPTKTHMVVEVAVGHSALLECVVAGGKVVWEKVNASLPVSLTDDGARVRQVWGNLRINEVSVDDAGTYVCHALSPIANADLSHPDHPRVTYKLHVYAPTAAKLLIEQQADSAWLLSCEAKNMAWEIPMVFINGLPLVDAAEKLGVLPGTNFYSNPVNLTIAAHTSLSGAVQCLSRPAMAEAEVYGDAVQRGDAFNIFVEERPPTSGPIVTPPPPVHLIDTGPENATRSEGATVQLICFVSSAVVSVEWLKGDTTVDLNVNERVRLVGTATLEIADIRKSDEGRYTCVAIDAAGHRASAAAHLTVEAAEDDFYDEAWNSKDEDEFEKNVSTSPTSATSNDEANAEENIVESAEEEEEVISTPTPVSTIVLQTPKAFVSGQNVRVQWSVPPPAASRLDAFKVQLRRDDPTAEWIDTGDRIESHVRAYTVHGLVPGIKYKFRIGAIAGQATVISDATDWIAIEAVEPKIRAPDPAVIVSLEPLSSEALLLSWSHTAADSAAEVSGFEIGYRSRPSTRDRNNQLFETINAGINEREHILDALLPSTTYEVYIVAVNKAGRSAKSNMKHASTTS